MNDRKRIAELEALAAEEGLRLPYPPDVIARLEDSGAVVDLVTGAVIVAGAEVRYGLTAPATANAVVWGSEGQS